MLMNFTRHCPTLTKYNKEIVVILLVVCSYFLQVRQLVATSIWGGDQVYQLSVMTGSLWDVIKILPHHEHCSYLSLDYFVVYPFFKLFGYNKWG